MNIVEQNVSVAMWRKDLNGIPDYRLPRGYRFRAYQPGDEHNWVRIELDADRYNQITFDLYRKAFGYDAKVLSERQFFLLNQEGTAIGTATAWFDDEHKDKSFGRVHWVAIHPKYQGLGLAKPLLSKVCRRLRELGYDKACLGTSTARIPAIRLYMSFGFVPEIIKKEDETVWKRLKKKMKDMKK